MFLSDQGDIALTMMVCWISTSNSAGTSSRLYSPLNTRRIRARTLVVHLPYLRRWNDSQPAPGCALRISVKKIVALLVATVRTLELAPALTETEATVSDTTGKRPENKR